MVFSAFGLAGLLYSLVLTRRATKLAIGATRDADQALEVASRNADAASRLAELSEQTARQQLRAYVSVEPCGMNEAVNGVHRVPLLLHNSGETPAHKIMIFSRFALSQHPRDFDPKDSGQPLSAEVNDASLGRGVQRHVFTYVRNDFLSDHLDLITQKKWAILHFGYIVYEDIFGKCRHTHFAFYHWGEELSDLTSLRCRFGNSEE